MGKRTAENHTISASCKVWCRYSVKGLCFCLLSILTLWWGGFVPVHAAADDPVLQRLEDMSNRLEKVEVTDQRLIALITSLNMRFIHYRVDGTGNLITGEEEGADFDNTNANTKPVVIQKSENIFCAISKATSMTPHNAGHVAHCEVARNAKNLWVITAKVHSTCRVACVGMELIRKDQRLPAPQ